MALLQTQKATAIKPKVTVRVVWLHIDKIYVRSHHEYLPTAWHEPQVQVRVTWLYVENAHIRYHHEYLPRKPMNMSVLPQEQIICHYLQSRRGSDLVLKFEQTAGGTHATHETLVIKETEILTACHAVASSHFFVEKALK